MNYGTKELKKELKKFKKKTFGEYKGFYKMIKSMHSRQRSMNEDEQKKYHESIMRMFKPTGVKISTENIDSEIVKLVDDNFFDLIGQNVDIEV